MKKMNIQMMLGLTILFALGVSSCVVNRVDLPTDAPSQAEEAVEAAARELGRQLGVSNDSIKVISVQPAEWPDSCLGVSMGGEMCAQVITKGFIGLLEVNGAQYEFRTDESRAQVRIIPQAVNAAIQALGYKLGISIESISLVSFEKQEWNNSCLGVKVTKEVCMDVITPGYRVILGANGEEYVYHTDESGKNLALAEFPLPSIGDALIVWSEYDELGCQLVLIDLDEVSFGACEGTLETVPFPDKIDRGTLVSFVEKYAPFDSEAAWGKISLTGEGSVIATAEEQVIIAEWARRVKEEADKISG